MDVQPYKLVVMDASTQAVMLLDGITGAILKKIHYPAGFSPTDLVTTPDSSTAYIPMAGDNCYGAIFVVDLKDFTISKLPLELPHPAQFSLAEGPRAYFVDPGGTLYSLDIKDLKLSPLGRPEVNASCVGLTAGSNRLYSAWEHDTGGTIAVFDHDGKILIEHNITGIPTNICLSKDGRIVVPFTTSAFTGEGLTIYNAKDLAAPPVVITTHCRMCCNSLRSYPCHVTFANDGSTAYVVNEDSATITIINLTTYGIMGFIPVGRSLSYLHILPDPRFGIATSQMFGNMSLIDLVNGRLLAVTDTNPNLLCCIAVLPN